MDDTAIATDRQVLLSDPAYLFADCWCIPYLAERELGPASQTLGAFERLCAKNGSTFASVPRIAEMACVPLRTCERHIEKLIATGWIERIGRQKRRTNTYKITKKFRDNINSRERRLYPRFGGPEWTWSMRAVFAVVANAQLSACVGIRDTCGNMPEDLGEEAIYRSVSAIAKATGLTWKSTRKAIGELRDHGYLYAEDSEYSENSLLLYVNNVPMPQMGYVKVAGNECVKVAGGKRVTWEKVAGGLCKSGGRPYVKVAGAVSTTLSTTSNNHRQASADAWPDGPFVFAIEGREEGKPENPAFDPHWLLDHLAEMRFKQLVREDWAGAMNFFCAAIASQRSGVPVYDILLHIRGMLSQELYDWQEPLLPDARELGKRTAEIRDKETNQ